MCGICGFISDRSGDSNKSLSQLKTMNDQMTHRGPNDRGEEIFYDSNLNIMIGLAHRRLSIIDLTNNGHQPMHSPQDDIVVVFNGEIYNFEYLKSLLVGEYHFVTNCDTEVIIAAYKKWGQEMFSHLDGMFAIALYDRKNKCFILGRDRLGKKPLYYYTKNETSIKEEQFVFASELKPILKCDSFKKEICTSVLQRYLSQRYIYG